MKMWAAFPIIMILGILALACQEPEPTKKPLVNRPADLKITYHWDTGSLPPKYHYSYEIILESDGTGQFIFQQSYAGNGAPTPSVTTFTVPSEKINQLYQLLLTKNMLRTEWVKKQPLIGGSSSELQINADGKTFSIPNDTLMIEKDKTDSAEVYDFIKKLAPKVIWDELANIRNQIETATDIPAQ